MKWQRSVWVVMLLSWLMNQSQAELVHQWKFNGFASDEVGPAHGMVSGGAELDDGRLFIDGLPGSRFLTEPIGNPLDAKTFVSWVSLNDAFNSSKGSALTLQNNPNGDVFDAIVYGEVLPETWMAGSNFFARTQNPQEFGDPETVEDPGEVMISIAYDLDDSISIYRDGDLYGSYTKGILQPFDENAVVQIGPRHGAHPDVFEGFVNEARIYSTALSEVEIQDIFSTGPDLTPSREPPPPPPPPEAELRHQWTFNGNPLDTIGEANGRLFGGAQITCDDLCPDGRLFIDGVQGSRMLTDELGEPLESKSLVAWVSLSDVVNSSKGSALTVQNDADGSVFDAIVYGEVLPEHWMAGSNGFVRTQNPQEFGEPETVEDPGEVMITIVYDTDNSITLYRDGEVYGTYSKSGIQPFEDTAVVQIGPRHGNHPDVFEGFVNEARLYSGPLTADQVTALFTAGPSTVPNPEVPPPPPPPPVVLAHQWTFDGTIDDQVGNAHGELVNDASLTEDGRLELDAFNGDQFRTDPIDEDIKAKTLIAWVSLNDLDDPVAGSALTIQEAEGTDVFDGIIYAERTSRQWMAGSNFFQRSGPADNGGEEESVTDPGEVMVAITYDDLGNIVIYRDGEEYAQYQSVDPPTYRAGLGNILIGPRHDDLSGGVGPQNFFDGLINEARVYNGALTAEEIAAVFSLGLGSTGDFNGNGLLEAEDIDLLSAAVLEGSDRTRYDLNEDGLINDGDRTFWVHDLKNTWFGDADLDGEFGSGDLVAVFAAGKYENGETAGWSAGDWNGDMLFGTGDLVLAFADGGYEVGERPGRAEGVPEPSSLVLALLGLTGLMGWASRRGGESAAWLVDSARPIRCRTGSL